MIDADTRLTGVDTNVMLRAMLADDEEQSAIARRFLRTLSVDRPGFVTQVALAEIYWVLTRTAKLSRLEALSMLRGIIHTEVLEFDDGESVVRALALAEEGADFADALIQGTMELFGAHETVTFDRRAADRLGWRLLDDTA
ncbi:MAG: type II toxin-antitoxin system VapC family toxin [Microbacterium sp.]|uniref:PIN domain-containing protein n=1 Tax=Microbacterium sp. TaxID=51671 RepID=UPI0039E23185